MKLIVRSFLTPILLGSFLLFTSFYSSSLENDYLLVRVFESPSSLYSSKITVTDGKEIIKSVELSAMRPKHVEDNVLKIASILNELKNQGYTLISSNSGGNEAFTFTDYIFEKK